MSQEAEAFLREVWQLEDEGMSFPIAYGVVRERLSPTLSDEDLNALTSILDLWGERAKKGVDAVAEAQRLFEKHGVSRLEDLPLNVLDIWNSKYENLDDEKQTFRGDALTLLRGRD